jgi:hypothetical protein
MHRRRASLISLTAALILMAGFSAVHPSVVAATTVATRNAYAQPFSSTSIWNEPIGSGAAYVPAQIAPPTIRALTADQTVALMDPNAPITMIASNGGQHSNRCNSGGPLAMAPIPASLVVPSSTANYGYAVVAADGSTLIEGGAFARCSSGSPPTAGSAKTFGSIMGDGLTGGAGGSGLSTLGGLLRVNELVPGGQIDHAVRVNLDGAADLYAGPGGFRWPATREDGYGATVYGGHNPALKMGALLALPANLNLASLGLTSGPGMILARALQDYGAYVSNDTARPVFSIDTETGDASTVDQFQSAWGFPFETSGVSGSPWADDIMLILRNLAVVDNNGPSTVAGGGTPRVPLAPPLGASGPVLTLQNQGPTLSGHASLGNGTTGGDPQPAVTIAPDGAQLIFWQGAGGHLFESWWQGKWNGPVDWTAANGWAGALSSAPTVAVARDGTQLVFWKGPGGHLLEAWWQGKWNGPVDWTAAKGWGSPLTSAPSVTFAPDGTQLVFWQGGGGHLTEAWWQGKWNGPVDWTAANHWSPSLTSASSVALAPDGTQIIFWKGPGGHLLEAWWHGKWNGPVDWTVANRWSPSLTSAPSVRFAPDGTQLIFWQGAGGHLDEVWWNGKWNGPVDWTAAKGWGSPLTSAPSAAIAPDGTQLIFWQGAGGHLIEVWWQGKWNGPADWSA